MDDLDFDPEDNMRVIKEGPEPSLLLAVGIAACLFVALIYMAVEMIKSI